MLIVHLFQCFVYTNSGFLCTYYLFVYTYFCFLCTDFGSLFVNYFHLFVYAYFCFFCTYYGYLFVCLLFMFICITVVCYLLFTDYFYFFVYQILFYFFWGLIIVLFLAYQLLLLIISISLCRLFSSSCTDYAISLCTNYYFSFVVPASFISCMGMTLLLCIWVFWCAPTIVTSLYRLYTLLLCVDFCVVCYVPIILDRVADIDISCFHLFIFPWSAYFLYLVDQDIVFVYRLFIYLLWTGCLLFPVYPLFLPSILISLCTDYVYFFVYLLLLLSLCTIIFILLCVLSTCYVYWLLLQRYLGICVTVFTWYLLCCVPLFLFLGVRHYFYFLCTLLFYPLSTDYCYPLCTHYFNFMSTIIVIMPGVLFLFLALIVVVVILIC